MTETMRDALDCMRDLELLDCSLPGSSYCPYVQAGRGLHSSTLRALLRRGMIEEARCRVEYDVIEFRLTDKGRKEAFRHVTRT